ncbi:DNA polymerase/3'-5' exonuclease PolX, partial [Klebsiella pneumoniae]
AVEKGVLLSINPDAHKQEGLLDVQYGIYVARKGGLEAKNCLNAMNLQEIETFLQNKKRNA